MTDTINADGMGKGENLMPNICLKVNFFACCLWQSGGFVLTLWLG